MSNEVTKSRLHINKKNYKEIKNNFRDILIIETTGLHDWFNTKGIGGEGEKGDKGYS